MRLRIFAGPAGLAAILGGLFWTFKGLAILVRGSQPPLLFELAPVLFSVGLIGLYATLNDRHHILSKIGLALAIVSGVSGVFALVFKPPGAGEEELSPWILSSSLTNIAALITLGLSARRSSIVPAALGWLPLVLGLSTLPLMALGGALSSIQKRLLEIPIVLLGLGWGWFGYLLASARPAWDREPAEADRILGR